MEDETSNYNNFDGKCLDTETTNALKQNFPPKNDSEYCGKCSYCNVEIFFDDVSSVKIIHKSDGTSKKTFLLYHHGCYDRYLRRTID